MVPGYNIERYCRGRRCRSLMAGVIIRTDIVRARSTARDWSDPIGRRRCRQCGRLARGRHRRRAPPLMLVVCREASVCALESPVMKQNMCIQRVI